MKKILRLTQNELIKQLKKLSTLIIIGLILLGCLALPMMVKIMSSGGYTFTEQIEDSIQSSQQQIEYYQNAESTNQEENKIALGYEKARLAFYQQAKDWGVADFDDWRSDSVYNAEQLSMQAAKYQMMLDGLSVDLLHQRYSFGEDPEQLKTMSKEELTKLLNQTKQTLNTTIQAIKKKDYSQYLHTRIRENNEAIQTQLATIKEMKALWDQNPSDESAKLAYENAQGQLNALQIDKKVMDYRDKNGIERDKGWKSQTLQMISNKGSVANPGLMSKKEFDSNGYTYEKEMYKTYDKYLAAKDEEIRTAKDDMQKYWYSLEHNIPTPEADNGIRNFLTMMLPVTLVVMVLAIIVAGSIVSGEYSKGTIRLLMLRPAARWKILLSKYASVLLISLATLLGGVICMVLGGTVAIGVGDLFTPILSCQNGVVTQQAFILWYLPKLLFSSINILYGASLAFAMSTLFKNTALSVGLSIFATFGGPFAMGLAPHFPWLQYTPFPYYNLAQFATQNSYTQDIAAVFGPGTIYGGLYGGLLLAGLSIVVMAISFAVFQKRDVKN